MLDIPAPFVARTGRYGLRHMFRVVLDARRALQVQRMLAAPSQRGRKIPDLLVAAAAEELGITVLHYDADFDRIAAVTGQRCLWVVSAGSIP